MGYILLTDQSDSLIHYCSLVYFCNLYFKSIGTKHKTPNKSPWKINTQTIFKTKINQVQSRIAVSLKAKKVESKKLSTIQKVLRSSYNKNLFHVLSTTSFVALSSKSITVQAFSGVVRRYAFQGSALKACAPMTADCTHLARAR